MREPDHRLIPSGSLPRPGLGCGVVVNAQNEVLRLYLGREIVLYTTDTEESRPASCKRLMRRATRGSAD